jgi:hypothetical protein
LWIVAWIIAEAIPVFSSLLSLIVCSILCYQSLFLLMLTFSRLLYSVAGSPLDLLVCFGST